MNPAARSVRSSVTRLSLRLLVVAVATACALLASSGADVARASEQHPTMEELSREVVCPSCGTTLDRSDSPAADRMRAYIRARIDEGWTKQQILDGLVAEYGGDEGVLAQPRVSGGRGALAWAFPLVLLLSALAGGALTVVLWRRRAAQAFVAASSSSSTKSSNPSSS